MRFMRRDLFYARYVYETASVERRQVNLITFFWTRDERCTDGLR